MFVLVTSKLTTASPLEGSNVIVQKIKNKLKSSITYLSFHSNQCNSVVWLHPTFFSRARDSIRNKATRGKNTLLLDLSSWSLPHGQCERVLSVNNQVTFRCTVSIERQPQVKCDTSVRKPTQVTMFYLPETSLLLEFQIFSKITFGGLKTKTVTKSKENKTISWVFTRNQVRECVDVVVSNCRNKTIKVEKKFFIATYDEIPLSICGNFTKVPRILNWLDNCLVNCAHY